MTTVVMLYSSVISLMSSSILTDVSGSRPEFGSSQNKYLGFITMARAMPTRFFMPPLSSEGIRSAAWSRPTRDKQKRARSSFLSSEKSVSISSGKRTFSSAVLESKSAPPWNKTPISRLISLRVSSLLFQKSRPL